MNKRSACSALVLLFWCFEGLALTTADASRCINIESDSVRLACYDNIFKASVVSRPKTLVKKSIAEPEPTSAPLSKPQAASTTMVTKTAPVIASSSASVNNVSSNAQEQAFGRVHLKQQEVEESLSKIVTSVSRISKDPRKNRIFSLANGQVWRETEKSRLNVKNGQQVYVEQGALTAFYLGREGKVRRIKVKRVK